MQRHIGRSRQFRMGIQSARDADATTIFDNCFLDGTELNKKDENLAIECGGRGSRSVVSGFAKLKEYSEPSVNAYAGSKNIGLFLAGAFGSVATTADSPEAGANTHDFSENTTNDPTYYTIWEQAGGDTTKVQNAVFSNMTLTFNEDGFIEVQSNLLGDYPQADTTTFTSPSQSIYTFGTFSISIANDIGGIDFPEAQYSIKSGTLNIENNAAQEFGGGLQPKDAYTQALAINGSIERTFADSDIDDAVHGNTPKYVRLKFEHSDDVDGTSTKQSFEVHMPRVFLSEISPSGGLDDVRMEGFTFTATPNDSSVVATAKVVNDVVSYT